MHSLEVQTFTFAKPDFIGVAIEEVICKDDFIMYNKGWGVARIAFFDTRASWRFKADSWLSQCDPDWECFSMDRDGHLNHSSNRPDSKATTEYFNLAMSAWAMAKVADLGCEVIRRWRP